MPDHDATTNLRLEAFLEHYRADRERGCVKPLAEYLRAYGADAEEVARHYIALKDESIVRQGGERNRIGIYRTIKELGRGGQGVVYLAEDDRLRRKVALKVLTATGLGSETQIQRFRREAEVTSKLDHPGICGVLDVGTFEGMPYIAMRLVDGETLATKIARARGMAVGEEAVTFVDIEEVPDTDAAPQSGDTLAAGATTSSTATAVEVSRTTASGAGVTTTGVMTRRHLNELLLVFEKCARALHLAHEAGIIHRDIKPGNIMVGKDAQPVILDFGLARDDTSEDAASLTATGDVFGTPAYMSPEQIAGRELDRRSDIYSLGVTLYECLTLARPFDAPTREGLYQAILSKPVSDPRRTNRAIPSDLKVILDTTLDKDRDRRYQTAEALADELRRVRDHVPIRAKPISPVVRLVRFAQRHPGVAIALCAAFLSLSIGLVSTMIQKRRADENATRAAVAAAEAERSAAEARANLLDWNRLADGRRVEDLINAANDELWPATPEQAPAMERWIVAARDLATRLDAHRTALALLRERARSYDAAARQRDRATHGAAVERLAAVSSDAERVRQQLAATSSAAAGASVRGGAEQLEEHLSTLDKQRKNLEAQIATRLTWDFDRPEDKLKHDKLADLVRMLSEFVGEAEPGRVTIASVEQRLDLARSLEARTVAAHARAWRDAAAAALASPAYGGLTLRPQPGLVPLGADKKSGLLEFADVQTGSIPARREDGTLAIGEDTAIVFVLLPGCEVDIGAQRNDVDGPNFDQRARDEEGPVHGVLLDPFFISKFEMTQGQWTRFTGANPSQYAAGRETGGRQRTLMNPVEQVTWSEASDVLRRLGFVLPTEAQWEYAARGGTTSAWSCGDEPASLAAVANVADAWCRAHGGLASWTYESWDDGHTVHAPVGSFAPNPFGLHDVHGNLWEWCRDGWGSYVVPSREGDGFRPVDEPASMVFRGGGFAQPANQARSAFRSFGVRQLRTGNVGIRPARVLRK